MGAASADAFYGTVAAFGLTFLSSFLIDNASLLRLIGGVFLLYLGVRTLFTAPADEAAAVKRGGSLIADYLSTLFLTITNPMTILAFLAIFAGAGIVSEGGDDLSAVVIVLGVFSGSALWWLTLSMGIAVIWSRLATASRRNALMVWINRASGVIIIAFAVLILFGSG